MGNGGQGAGPVGNGEQIRATRKDAEREWSEWFAQKIQGYREQVGGLDHGEQVGRALAAEMASEVVAVFQSVKDSFERQIRKK